MTPITMRMPNQFDLPVELQQELTVLAGRSASLNTIGRKSLWGSAAIGVGAIAALSLSNWLAPSATLSAAHIPATVATALADVSGGNYMSPGLQFDAVYAALRAFSGGIFMKIAAVLVLALGVAASLVTGRFILLVMACAFGVVMTSAPALLDPLLGSASPGTYSASDKSLTASMTSGDVAAVQSTLQAIKVAPSDKAYLVGQTALLAAQRTNTALDKALLRDALPSIHVDANAAVLKPIYQLQVLYALERSALGTAQSTAARRYETEAKQSADTASVVAISTGTLATLLSLFGVAAIGLARDIRNRLRRISPHVLPEHASVKATSFVEHSTSPVTNRDRRAVSEEVDALAINKDRPPSSSDWSTTSDSCEGFSSTASSCSGSSDSGGGN